MWDRVCEWQDPTCRRAAVNKSQKSKFPFPLILIIAPVVRRVVTRGAMPRSIVTMIHAVVFMEGRGHVLRKGAVVRRLV